MTAAQNMDNDTFEAFWKTLIDAVAEKWLLGVVVWPGHEKVTISD